MIRTLSDKIGEQLTTHLRAIADANPLLKGIIDRVDFNATTHGVRDLADDRLSNLIEAISAKRLGLADVEPDIIGRSYEYLIHKFAEGSVSSAGEFYTPTEVGFVMARIMNAEPGMEIYDPCCGSAGLLVKCEIVLDEKMNAAGKKKIAPLRLHGQEYVPETWAMANMNMIIHDMEGQPFRIQQRCLHSPMCCSGAAIMWCPHSYPYRAAHLRSGNYASYREGSGKESLSAHRLVGDKQSVPAPIRAA
jgi:type I restriction enzyme M protein